MTGKVSIITGAGSGIGRALALAQATRGVTVIAADVDAAAAGRTAQACGAAAWSCGLDVRNAADVDALVHEVATRHGRIDYLFNNAGIGVGGEAFEIDRAHWDRIVNTASLAGLGPAPLLAPYSMTKHAVVGLSTSLRIEAKRYGVQVSVLCPAAIETPLLDSMNPPDLAAVPWTPDIRRFLTNLAGAPYPADAFAGEALAAIARNRAVIVIPRRARLAWRLGRMFPGLAEKASGKFVALERRHRSP